MGKSSRSRDSVRLGKENISNGKKWERRRNHPTALWEASSVQTRLTRTTTTGSNYFSSPPSTNVETAVQRSEGVWLRPQSCS